jgi:hypothetical protein
MPNRILALPKSSGLARYIASLTYLEAREGQFEEFRRKHKIERRFRVERRLLSAGPPWGDLRSGKRRRALQ